MPRVKRGNKRRLKRKKILRRAKGYYLAKSKLYLMTSDPIDGREAERIGLVSLTVPADEVLATAMNYARRLATGPTYAVRFTKKALNQWLTLGGLTAHDYSH